MLWFFTRKPYVEKDIKEFKGVKLVTLPTIKHKSLEAFLHTLIGIFVALRYKPDVLHIQAIGPALFTPLARIFHKKMKEAKVSASLDRAMESLRSIRLAYCYYPRKAQPVRKICRLSSTEKELLTALNLEIPEVR